MQSHVKNVVAQTRVARNISPPRAGVPPAPPYEVVRIQGVRSHVTHLRGPRPVCADKRDGLQVAASAAVADALHHLRSTTLRTASRHIQSLDDFLTMLTYVVMPKITEDNFYLTPKSKEKICTNWKHFRPSW
ncbi:unnamed protein product [Leptidea sinapis]|uniref:Uncharacterized protein n=1 Tax=Leptidea sinapis TaxID=189913 RepID=A0A5E4QHP9_9NEOP|nr:unnamed protein product [Leptidea sinapis]